jgi:ATP-binding cassette subfamily B protein
VPPVDVLSLRAAARARPRTLRSLTRLVRQSLLLVWEAGRAQTLALIGLQLLGTVATVAQIAVAQWSLTAVVGGGDSRDVVRRALPAVIVLAVATALAGVSGSAMNLRSRLLSERTTRRVLSRVLDVTQSVDLATYETSEFYDHLSRVKLNATSEPYAVTNALTSLIGGLLGTVGVAAALFTIQPVLVPLLMIGGVPMWFAQRRAANWEFSFMLSQTAGIRRRTYIDGILSGRAEAKEIRAFGMGPMLRASWETGWDGFLTDLRLLLRRRHLLMLGAALASALITAAVLALLLWFLQTGRVSIAGAGAALIGVRLLSSRVAMLLGGIARIFAASLFLEDLDDFFGRQPAASDEAPRASARDRLARMEARDVSFAYPGTDHDVLHGVTLTISRGEVVALVGENGSGKTTLAKLMAGLYSPGAGEVSWLTDDGRAMTPAETRRDTAVVFQDFVRFQLTARENVGLGRPESVEDLPGIRAAAREAEADGFLSALQSGYETTLSKEYAGGADLSLGQWQRVALARALYRDAAFVILDEPTASLDARAEHDLFADIRRLVAGRGVLLISHRFSSVRSADRILVLRDGAIIEDGTHDELMALGGLYAELFTLQAAAYLDVPTVP